MVSNTALYQLNPSIIIPDPHLVSLLPFARLNTPNKTVQTQTPIVLVTNPDLFQLQQAFLVPEKPKSPKRVIKLDQSEDFYIKEMQPQESKGAIPKQPEDKGRSLHRSEKELHLPKRSRKSYNALCKDCERLQRLCLSCRKLIELKKKRKQRAAFKESAYEGFDKVFLDILSKTVQGPMEETEGECKGTKSGPHLTGQEVEFLQQIESSIAELLDKQERTSKSVGQLPKSECNTIIGDSWTGDSIVLFKRADFQSSNEESQPRHEEDLDNISTELEEAKSYGETEIEGQTTKGKKVGNSCTLS